MMQHARTFVVVPSLPEPLEPLRTLAYNLWWCWNPPAMDLFRRLDVDLWQAVGNNPVALLWQISQTRLDQAARDDAYMAQLCRVMDAFYIYMNARTWYDEHGRTAKDETIAYFSAEFGLHECMPIYSGGLGVLAGDHLKSASDLGIPLIAIGLMYRQGYFTQQLTEDGWQLESYPVYDFHQWPAKLVTDSNGDALKIGVHFGHQLVHAQIWRVNVGRVPLYLLDTDISDNAPDVRVTTARLYGGDARMRIRQEILLGIGGLRALRAMGIKPNVCHMNEGHAAFLALERARQHMKEHSLSWPEAREAVTAGHVFTTHTPVPAGIDRFDARLFESHLPWMPGELGITMSDLLAVGRDGPQDESFCMPILALRLSFRSNGVSLLHGEVARSMWQSHWPSVPVDEIPIRHVTNGIHTRTWMNPAMADLFDQYLGPGWTEAMPEDPLWKRIDEIPDAELWRVHVRRREWMIAFMRRRLREQLKGRGAPPAEVKAADEVLDPEALTIGFARRFAPYKRATLVFKSVDRLMRLLQDVNRPIQFVFAGKAHPADGGGKELIKAVAAVANRPDLRRRIVFLENYDMSVARAMVQGVDVWLNNPLRLHEASGTSGMKVPANGGLNLSCLDGWWPEAYTGDNGWAIGDGRVYDDLAYQDHVESESLYNLLEREIVPLFYERTADNLPRGWVARVKRSMRTIVSMYNTHRMLRDYAQGFYVPALTRARRVAAESFKLTRELAQWRERIRRGWHAVRVVDVRSESAHQVKVGDAMPLTAQVALGDLMPDDVSVEVYYGQLDGRGELRNGRAVTLERSTAESDGEHVFHGAIPCDHSGRHSYAIRVVPRNPDIADRYDQGLILWA